MIRDLSTHWFSDSINVHFIVVSVFFLPFNQSKVGRRMVLLVRHPDFEQERQRLDFTKRYIDVVIKTSETSKDQFQRNMQEAFGDADWSESGLYSQLLTTANFFEMSRSELESLRMASKSLILQELTLNEMIVIRAKYFISGKLPFIRGKARNRLSSIGDLQ